jgi:hypothetical protein
MKALDRRMMKLEATSSDSGPVFVVVGPDDDMDELLRQRFGEDGPPVGLTVFLVKTGVPRRMSV